MRIITSGDMQVIPDKTVKDIMAVLIDPFEIAKKHPYILQVCEADSNSAYVVTDTFPFGNVSYSLHCSSFSTNGVTWVATLPDWKIKLMTSYACIQKMNAVEVHELTHVEAPWYLRPFVMYMAKKAHRIFLENLGA